MYNHQEIEKKWQLFWDQNKSYKTSNNNDNKYYVLDMFPYPSGSGLHVGHPKGYTATDIIARYKRLKGFDVLHPIGWDAFGLPAEQYALKTKNDPNTFTLENIDNFRQQLKKVGFSFDFDREINTTDPNYYKWTQWIFKKLYENDLAVLKKIPVNWCEELGTVLANEEVIEVDGKQVSERGNFLVTQKLMKQWVLKITKYADILLKDLDDLNWSKSLKTLQKNWIGKNDDGTYHLRDWVFSRQRYWGEPFPILFNEDNEIFLVDSLPVLLPKIKDIKPSGTGESPLANEKEWLYVTKNNIKFRRETNTMPQWAGSSWYHLAYILKNEDGTYLDLDSKEAWARFKKWLPVDLYIGGQEHAVLHLLYARFWHKFLYDIKVVPTKEPFSKIINQGMILGTDNLKMSKSRGNTLNPDKIIDKYGADTLRVYEMFMGSLEDTIPWSEETLHSMSKWLSRVKKLFDGVKDKTIKLVVTEDLELASAHHKFLKSFEFDLNKFKFNTPISKLMIFVNYLYENKTTLTKKVLTSLAITISLYAPHLGEEFLEMLGERPISEQKFPQVNEKLIISEKNTIALQINGKTRGFIKVDSNILEKEILELAKDNFKLKKHLKETIILKVIYVKNRIVNFVTK